MSLTPGRIWRGAPAIGEDTTDIPAKLLGLAEPDIQKLYYAQIVHRTFMVSSWAGKRPWVV